MYLCCGLYFQRLSHILQDGGFIYSIVTSVLKSMKWSLALGDHSQFTLTSCMVPASPWQRHQSGCIPLNDQCLLF